MEATPSIRDRSYAFNTYYIDTPSHCFYKSGFSLRHRTGVREIDKIDGTELKALEGSIGNISARLEIEQLGQNPIDNYNNLIKSNNYPLTAPNIVDTDNLSIIFATSVRRVERRAMVRLDNRDVMIEAALDDISYLRNEAITGRGLYDCVLMPVKTEFELEFETKGDITTKELEAFYPWARDNCITHTAIETTTKSKALRARKFVLR